jgi:tRNA G37 N-methylase Trm5
MILKNSLNQSHDYIKKVVKDGSITIDATAGNGNDTLFLANLVKSKGRVYSFDIQKKAINKTFEKIKKNNLTKNVKLICDTHENILKYINIEVDAVMFNLGYLPGGDHSICTRFESTKVAIDSSLKILKKSGLISIVIYHGGDSGFGERNKLLEYLEIIDPEKYHVMKTEFINQINCPPILVLIEKIS